MVINMEYNYLMNSFFYMFLSFVVVTIIINLVSINRIHKDIKLTELRIKIICDQIDNEYKKILKRKKTNTEHMWSK